MAKADEVRQGSKWAFLANNFLQKTYALHPRHWNIPVVLMNTRTFLVLQKSVYIYIL